MNNPIRWFEIYVDDMNRAKAFYEFVFNRELGSLASGDLEMWTFGSDQEMHGSGGALVKVDGFPAGGNSTIVYFSCEDCAFEEAKTADAGGEIVKSKFSIGEYGFVSLVKDTEGNMIGLHSMK
jgi:predicted enzyme related to lactoylglutathione lyase